MWKNTYLCQRLFEAPNHLWYQPQDDSTQAQTQADDVPPKENACDLSKYCLVDSQERPLSLANESQVSEHFHEKHSTNKE